MYKNCITKKDIRFGQTLNCLTDQVNQCDKYTSKTREN